MVLLVILGYDLGPEVSVENGDGGEFIAEPAGERLEVGVLPRRAGFDAHDPCG